MIAGLRSSLPECCNRVAMRSIALCFLVRMVLGTENHHNCKNKLQFQLSFSIKVLSSGSLCAVCTAGWSPQTLISIARPGCLLATPDLWMWVQPKPWLEEKNMIEKNSWTSPFTRQNLTTKTCYQAVLNQSWATEALASGVKARSTRWSQSRNIRSTWKPGSLSQAFIRQPCRKKASFETSVPLWGAFSPKKVYCMFPFWLALQYKQTPSLIHDALVFKVRWINFSSPFSPTTIPQ